MDAGLFQAGYSQAGLVIVFASRSKHGIGAAPQRRWAGRDLPSKWAFLPTSGAGAAIDGGRFNRPGVEALYLSRSTQTTLNEYKQSASITPPATLPAPTITLAEVADLAQGFDPDIWDGAWPEWDCAWRQLAGIDKKIPPSWKLT